MVIENGIMYGQNEIASVPNAAAKMSATRYLKTVRVAGESGNKTRFMDYRELNNLTAMTSFAEGFLALGFAHGTGSCTSH